MSTSTLFFDLSGAVPWFLMGVLATLLWWWLWRLVRRPPATRALPPPPTVQQALIGGQKDDGAGSLEAEKIGQLEDDLAAARTQAVKYADEKQKLESELRKLRDSMSVPAEHQTEMEKLRRSELVAKNQIADMTAELSSLRKERENSAAKTTRFETELANQQRLVAMRDAELDRIEKQSGGTAPQLVAERDHLRSEIVRIQSQLATAAGATKDSTELKLEIARLRTALSAASNSSAEAAQLRSQLTALQSQPPQTPPAAGGITQKLQSEIAALQEELENRAHQIRLRDAELDRLEKLVRAGSSNSSSSSAVGTPASVIAERDQLKANMEAARVAFEKLKADHIKAEQALYAVGPEIEELRRFKASNAAELARLSSQVTALTADLENFRRFKDALDTANRIALTRS
jgi:chromosome segregation ATPase